jgi:hypothetical protein
LRSGVMPVSPDAPAAACSFLYQSFLLTSFAVYLK